MTTNNIKTSKISLNNSAKIQAKKQFNKASRETVINCILSQVEFLLKKGLIGKDDTLKAVIGENRAGNAMFRLLVNGSDKFQHCVVFDSGFYKGRGTNAMTKENELLDVEL